MVSFVHKTQCKRRTVCLGTVLNVHAAMSLPSLQAQTTGGVGRDGARDGGGRRGGFGGGFWHVRLVPRPDKGVW